MKSLVRFICLGILISFISLGLECSFGSDGTAEIMLNAVVAGEGRSIRTADDDPWESTNISLASYKMHLTYFALERDDGLKVTLVDDESAELLISPVLLGQKDLSLQGKRFQQVPMWPMR